jgi:sugar phosphate isomerase/epimerase
MRLGGPVTGPFTEPGPWIEALQGEGYRAAFCPLAPDADDATVAAFRNAADEADVVIAEVGAWSNPISPDPDARNAALEKCKNALALAERIGARCCVNVAGSRGERWAGPHPNNITPETFDLIVKTVREIIDTVRPTRTFYTLETMPWMPPYSVDSYLELVDAIDRDAFAVHFDPVNLVNSPIVCYRNAELIRDFVARLGPRIRSVHAKDIVFHDKLTVHLDEGRPGTGSLDYGVLLAELDALEPDLPVMMEHLPDAGEYRLAAQHIRAVAGEKGITL